MIDTGKTRLLIDCGIFYGAENEGKNLEINFDPATIDYVLLTHAHMDHSGRLPILYKRGFKGSVLGTDATKSILGAMLEMSMGIAEGQDKALFDFPDYAQCMKNFTPVAYDQKTVLSCDVTVRLQDAGHILGSCLIEIWVNDKENPIKIVVAADLGSKKTPLLRDPVIIREADYVLIESTYGTSNRAQHSYSEFGDAIKNTLNQGGSVLIPAFTLEKTQKMLYVLGQLKRDGVIPTSTPVYADSSTGQDITRIYRKYTQYYDCDALKCLSASGNPLSFIGLKELSGKETMEAHHQGESAIYLSSSGMLDHAQAPKHLEQMIEDSRNLLLLVGWQAPGSLGRKIQEGAKSVSIPIESIQSETTTTTYSEKAVLMKVIQYSFSSHADGRELLDYLSHFSKIKEVFVIHGDRDNALGLAKEIEDKLGFKASVPSLNESRNISSTQKDCPIKRPINLYEGLKLDSQSAVSNRISDQ